MRKRFLAGRHVAAGSMGTVYQARDRRTQRTVAFKVCLLSDSKPFGPGVSEGTTQGASLLPTVILSELRSDSAPASSSCARKVSTAAHLSHEAEVLRRLDHPAIVQWVDDGGEAGENYLATEWLGGETLAHRLRRGRLSVGDALVLGERLASALAHASSRGVVHRDVKPSNVVLVGGSLARATLIDFGVAHAAGVGDVFPRGSIVGTVGYMAPEQAVGCDAATPSIDVFALGCLLFRCLAGVLPFRGSGPTGALRSLLLDRAPNLDLFVPSAPRDLVRLVATMLARKPADRPTAHEVMHMLATIAKCPANSCTLSEPAVFSTLRVSSPSAGAARESKRHRHVRAALRLNCLAPLTHRHVTASLAEGEGR